ncbi:MAG: hypothetical protein AB1455_07880 [Pseudomonadota bacterium]
MAPADAGTRVQIVADTDVTVSGVIRNDGREGVSGGQIDIRAGQNLTLEAGTLITASGQGANSGGGTVYLYANNNAVTHTGAAVKASAGSTGDGGAIEFSAKNSVELAGGQFAAGATGGQRGTVLIDPTDVVVSADQILNGANYEIVGGSFTVNEGVVVSTRMVGAGDQLTGASTGASGHVTIQMGRVDLKANSMLLAHADNGHAGGQVTINAHLADGGAATIKATGALITGATVKLDAQSVYTDLSLPLPVTAPSAQASINLTDTTVRADGQLTLSAQSSVNTTTATQSPVGTTVVDSKASVDVGGTSQLTASGDATLSAQSTVKAKVEPKGDTTAVLPVDAGVAVNVIESTATVRIGGMATVTTGGALSLDARNEVQATTVADVTGGDPAAVGGTVAETTIVSRTSALIEDTATTSTGSLQVRAESKNTAVTTAKAVAKGATKQTDAQKATDPSRTEATLDKYKEEGKTSEGSVDVAAAVAVAVIDSRTQAAITSTGAQTSTGVAALSSQASNSSTVAADGSTVDGSQANVGVGAAVALNIGVLSNTALVGDGANVTAQGLTVQAGLPVGEKNSFTTSSTSGAGAANVGVAGSLAVNTVVADTAALLKAGSNVNAGTGDVLIAAEGASDSTVKAGADVKGAGDSAKVGVGASVGVNVAVNSTVAEVANNALLTGGANLGLNAAATHTMNTEVTGGAAGAKVSVTPVAAVSVGANSTVARLGEGTTGLDITGSYSSLAQQSSVQTTKATGQTQGNQVAVGASLALGIADDTVQSSVERDVEADGSVSVAASSVSKSDTTATASVKGGQKADGADKPKNADGSDGKTVDQQAKQQGDGAKLSGKKTAAKADASSTGAGGSASNKLDGTKGSGDAKAETSEGGVSVAAAVGINIADGNTGASVANGVQIRAGGALTVSSAAEADASAKADGSQVDSSGQTDVGVGAAVAVNVATSSNTALVKSGADVHANGLSVMAKGQGTDKSDFTADAKSGAGAANVGVAGSLAINTVVNDTSARLENSAYVDAGSGAVLIEAGNATTSTVKSGAVVKNSGSDAAVGVGASVGVNVAVNDTVAEVADGALLTGGANLGLNARADHTMLTDVTGGAAGGKVVITPVVAVSISENTTMARLGTAGTGVGISGTYSSEAAQTSVVTTKGTGQAQGDVAVGAAVAVAIAQDDVQATVGRNLTAATGVSLDATSDTSLSTVATASAKGAKQAKKNDSTGEEEPEAGTTVDEQKKDQLDYGKSRNSKSTVDTAGTPDAKTPDTSNKTPTTDKPSGAPAKEQQGKKVSVAAAIGVGVSNNGAQAAIGDGLVVSAGTGELKIQAASDTNYNTSASGLAVSDDIGVAAAVAITATKNTTEASLGAGTSVTGADDVTISATSRQNRDAAFQTKQSAEAISGASGGEVAVAGALALVVNDNTTRAVIEEGATLSNVKDVSVTADDTSKIAAQARAGAISMGSNSKVGVGASFAVLVSNNVNEAVVGRDTDKDGTVDATTVTAESLTVAATKHRVNLMTPDVKNFSVNDVKNLNFDAIDPATYLGSNNYYTEAIAGSASKGNVAVSGAFAVNVFNNTNNAALGANVRVTTTHQNADGEGVGVHSSSDTQAVSFVGGVAAAKQVGVGISNTNIVNQDKTTASIGKDASVLANGAGAGVKVTAENHQDIANIGVSAGVGAQGVGVGGVLGVLVSLGHTEASIGDSARVEAEGNVQVAASSDSSSVMVSGGVGVGQSAGVGAAIAAHVVSNTTRASIGEDAEVRAGQSVSVQAEADESTVSAVIGGAASGNVAVGGAVSVNVLVGDTQALVGRDATLVAVDHVRVRATDDTSVVAVTGGGAGSGGVGVGAALDTTVFAKTVRAALADDTDGDTDKLSVTTGKDVVIEADSSENLTSVTMGFAGGGNVGVGGAVSVGVVKNEVEARIGTSAVLDADGNVVVNAEDDITAVMTAGGAAGGGTAGVGGSIAVATLFGHTRATIGDHASVNARGNSAAVQVYSGDTSFADTSIKPGEFKDKDELKEGAKGLSVTAFNRENLITTVASGAGGGSAGVAATVSANVISSTTEASIGRSAKINEINASASSEQEVRVKAIDETRLINTAGGAAGGGAAGVGAAANVGVISKTTTASVGRDTDINARKAFDLQAASSDSSLSVTAGFAGGGSAGVGGAVAGVGLANTTKAFVEDGTSAVDAARINVTGGDLSVAASEFASSWMVSGAGAGGGAAGVGASMSIGVNTSETSARLGDFAVTNASGITSVKADSVENVNTITVAGAGGGAAGVSGSISINVVSSTTEAAIGKNARVNQDAVGQDVDVSATDKIVSVATAGAGAGGGAAGVGGTVAVTVALNTTTAAIEEGAQVSASRDVNVNAESDKVVTTATVAGAGGGAAGVAGAVAVLSVGSLLDEEAKKGLSGGQTQQDADGQTTKSAVGGMLGNSAQSQQTTTDLDSATATLGVSGYLSDSAPVPTQNVRATIAAGAHVQGGRDVNVKASDQTLAVLASGAGAGAGAAGVAGSVGVVLLRDSAAASVGDGAQVDAGRTLAVDASTREDVYNVGVSVAGGGAAGVSGAVSVNVISSETVAAIGAAQINQKPSASTNQSVLVQARSSSDLITVAGSGGGAGAAAVGGVVNVNTLSKDTSAHIAEGAQVHADKDVKVSADSQQQIIGASVSVRGAGAAAVGAAAAVNVIENNTEAFIGSHRSDSSQTAATVDSDGNVVISAADDTMLIGVVANGTGAGAAAVGGTVGVNVVSAGTRAYVGDHTVINARGNADAALVYSGAIDQTDVSALPTAPAGRAGVDLGDGNTGNISGGLSFSVAASGGGNGDASTTAAPSSTKDSEGNAIANTTGGLGKRGTEGVKGLSVTAVGSEKIITTSVGVAGAGAAGVTLGVTANVLSSTTEARIGDGAMINQAGGVGQVNVKASDDSFVVMAAGTVAGAAGAGVGGSSNTAVVGKHTSASIGDSARVKASGVQVTASSSEELYLATANVSAGTAGIGAASSVVTVANTTSAGIGAGATVDATGALRVNAAQDTSMDLYTVAGAAGVVGISGAVSVGVVDNTTAAYVGDGATLDANGTTEVIADSRQEMSSVTVSAAGGGVGVAGSVGVKVLTSETTATVGDDVRINQTRTDASQDVKIAASDAVHLKGGGGAGAIGLYGAGAIADVNIVRNTTAASIGDDAQVHAGRDVQMLANSTKQVDSTAVAIAGGYSLGIAGAVSVAVVGKDLGNDAQDGLGDGATASHADDEMRKNDAGKNLGDSSHLSGVKGTLAAKSGGLGVSGEMNDTSAASRDKTQAAVGSGTRVTAGRNVEVSASDKTQLDIDAVGAGAGFAGIGAAVGVGLTNSTTEATVGGSSVIDAVGTVKVGAKAANVNGNGSTVNSTAGAGGVVGVSAAVSVLDDSSVTRAYLGSNAKVEQASTVTVSAETDRKASATTLGASAGGLAIGASVARADFSGSTAAYLAPSVQVGQAAVKQVKNLAVIASDASRAIASATAGAAGIASGAGADAKARVNSTVTASVGSGSAITAQDDVDVVATATPQTKASAIGVSVGGGAVGASLATAQTGSTVEARIDSDTAITADSLDVVARRQVGSAPSAAAQAFGASGGVLFGVNATLAKASNNGQTNATLGSSGTFAISGTTQVHADSQTQQVASGVGISAGGLLAVGAVFSEAGSDTRTQSAVGDNVLVSGGALKVLADSDDTNYAHGIAGSGGMVSAPFSQAKTTSTSQTVASTGSGSGTRKIDVGTLEVQADHDGRFDAWIDSTNASLVGVSGAKATNSSTANTQAVIGANGHLEADHISVSARNDIRKDGPASGPLPGVTNVAGGAVSVPQWNVNSSSGGLADVPAAESTTTITNHAQVQVQEGAHLAHRNLSPAGTYRVDAENKVTAEDRVKMASGAAVSAASGKSQIRAETNNARIDVADGALLSSKGDLSLGTRSQADISTQTAVDVWGLVGVAPQGDAVSRFAAANTIQIGSARLLAGNDLRLNAGAGSQYNPSAGVADGMSQATVRARSDVFNNTAIPVNRDPVADAIIQTGSQINIAHGARLEAVGHAALYAEKGAATASGVGVGKDLWREALAAAASAVSNAFGGGDVSFETRTGRSITTQTSGVTVNGEVHVGVNRKQNLVIGADGTVLSATDGMSLINTELKPVAKDILDRIDHLRNLIRQYTVDNASADASVAVAAYESEIRFLERKLLELGFKKDPEGNISFAGAAAMSPRQAAQEAVAAMTATKATYETEKTTKTNQVTGLQNQNSTWQGQITTLQSEINSLQAQIDALDTSAEGYAAAKAALEGQISTKQGQIATRQSNINANNTTIATVNSQIAGLDAKISPLTTQIASVSSQISSLSDQVAQGPIAKFVTVGDAEAKLGNIYVRGDRLQGSGVLDAPGDAEIRITNHGPSFLVLNDLTIPADEGGKLYFNSVDVKDNVGINGVNGAGGAAFTIFTAESQIDSSGNPVTPGKPQIVVESKYDPLDPLYIGTNPTDAALAPDIIVKGDISNLRGLVKIDSAAGSIRIEDGASIRADDVEVKTRNGDFVQSYSDGFFHAAGAPLTTTNGDPERVFPGNIAEINRTPEVAGKGIIANGSVLIAARYLNLNGTIQSGIPEWGVRIPENATVTVGGAAGRSFAQAQAHYNGLSDAQKAALGAEYYEVSGATVNGLSSSTWGPREQITVRYNAKENRLELSGVQVQGGYIELFGQVFNTNGNGGGKLRVLDGHGQIEINNQTGLAVWVNPLDTGKNVKGQINITNITGLKADGTPIIGTTSYVRGEGASRTGYSFNPQTGLRYNMTVGYDQLREDYYRYSQNGWFGINDIGSRALDEYRINSIVRTNDPLAQAEYLKVQAGLPHYSPSSEATYVMPNTTYPNGAIVGGQQQTETTSSKLTLGRSWRDCTWWTLCIHSKHYQEFTVATGSKTTITDSVKGDYPVAIEYIGFDKGKVDVTSVGNVVINGAINNASGDTRISSTGGRITQNGDLAIVSGQNVTLSAQSGIGSALQAVQTNIADSGVLNATSASGEVRVKEMVGDLRVGTIGGAGVSNVVLEADRHIVNANDATSVVQGKRVELLSNHGGVGTEASALNVKTGYTTNQTQWPNNGLMVTARDSINVRNQADAANPGVYNGNLLLISAESTTGDVRVETSGAVIDNNPFATTDSFTEAELANLWDELRLRGAASVEKADEAVAAYERGKDNNYRLYWQLRRGQADAGTAYDPGYVYQVSANERTALEGAGMDSGQIDAYQASRTQQYHTLHGEVGNLTAAFDSGFHYDASVATGTGEEAQIRKGATWTDAQLMLSVGGGLLKNITDTVTTIKAPNVKGNHIELVAGTSIGSVDTVTIDLSAGLSSLTTAQKAALAAAERGDATVTGDVITIRQPKAVNVVTGPTGALTATASDGHAYIGSEQDLRINRVSATEDIRIKTAGSLINAVAGSAAVNVTGGNLILESAHGGIGAIPDPLTGALGSPLRINLGVNASLIARAAGDIWVETPNSLKVDTVYSRSDVKLDAEGSILDMGGDSPTDPALNIRSRNLELVSRTGSVGEDDDALDVGVNADGRIVVTAATAGQGVFLHGPAGEHFNIGSSTSGGATSLTAANNMMVDGQVTGLGTVSLASGGTTTLTTHADVVSTAQGVQVRAGRLLMEDDGVAAARLRSDLGTIDIETTGDAIITGIESGNGTADAVRVSSTAGRILDGGDTRLDIIANAPPDAGLLLAAQKGVSPDGNALEIRVRNLSVESGDGSVHLSIDGDVNIKDITVGDAVHISATGNITGNSVTSTGLGTQSEDKTVNLSSTGGTIGLGSVAGQQDVTVDGHAGVSVDSVSSGQADVLLTSLTGDIRSGTASAGQNVTMRATSGNIVAGRTQATGGNVNLQAQGDIDADETLAGRDVLMGSSAGDIRSGTAIAGQNVAMLVDRGSLDAQSIRTGGSTTLAATGPVRTGTISGGRDVSVTSTRSTVTADRTEARGSVDLSGQRGVQVNAVRAGQDVGIQSAQGSVTAGNLQSTQGSIGLEAARNIEVGQAAALSGAFSARSAGGNITVGTASADAVNLAAPGSVVSTGQGLNVGSVVNLAGSNISATVNSTGAGDVRGSVTGFGGSMASNVQLTLNTPYAFRLDKLFTKNGNVNVLSGDLFVNSLWVGQQLTIGNPWTRVLVDQTDRSIRAYDVQLYSDGNPFAFGMTGKRVFTDSLVISRGRDHELISPNGSNLSSSELADREMALASLLRSPTQNLDGLTATDTGASAELVNFQGVPVRTEDDDCDDESGNGQHNDTCKD